MSLVSFLNRTRLAKGVRLIIFVLLLLAVASMGAICAILYGNLPKVRGKVPLSGLQSPTHIARDDLGIVTIDASDRSDLCRALGFTHAQERYFQMDCLRRASAGELSELVGSAAIKMDESARLQGLREVAQGIVTRLSPKESEWLLAYTDGVNAGLDALRCAPFEYWVLRARATPWQPEDTFLVCYNLFRVLQDVDGKKTHDRGLIYSELPTDVARFFAENGSIWDAAIDDSRKPLLPIPPAASFDYLSEPVASPAGARALKSEELPQPSSAAGSNCWAVTSDLTKSGQALLACDMHLHLGIPSIWYRARLCYRDEAQQNVHLDGVTLPGVPAIIIGSNQKIAWGFTNAQINTTDLLSVKLGPNETYFIDDQSYPLIERRERIKVRGEPDRIQIQRHTRWGPLLPGVDRDRAYVARWVGRDPRALDLSLLALEKVQSAEEAVTTAKTMRLPALNFFVADANGHIGWSVIGSIPDRNYKAAIPMPIYGDGGWRELLPPEKMPSKVYERGGRLWNANHRMLTDTDWGYLGSENMVNGIRGYQIRHALFDQQKFTPEKMLEIQLEDRALFFERWRDLLRQTLQSTNADFPRKAELERALNKWDGHCHPHSIGYPCIRKFRERVMVHVLQHMLAPCFRADPHFSPSCVDFEEPIWMLVSKQPEYLADPKSSWGNALVRAIEETIEHFTRHFPKHPLDQLEWAQCQRVKVGHPLTRALPALSWTLDMPRSDVGGDFFVPKVLYGLLGASQRMSVSPGQESAGQFHMPGGQSGNPLSKCYRSSHKFWQMGRFQPLAPGAQRHQLTLFPAP